MCKYRLFALALSFFAFQTVTVSAQVGNPCATAQYDSLMQHKDPTWKRGRQLLESLIQKEVSHIAARTFEETIFIPVVVHIVHHNALGTIGGTTNANITDEQILSQIHVLNEDYRRKEGTPGFNKNPVGADVNIEFYLAKRDPNGHITNGITRAYSEQASFNPDNYQDIDLLKSFDYWPSNRYLNIWVATLSNDYLGAAQFPTVPIDPATGGAAPIGLSARQADESDGIMINSKAFGRQTGTAISPVYGYGRTLTHEIGHWLGLLHTWGDYFCGDDYCNDTPPTESDNKTKDISCQAKYSNCTGQKTSNMIENYLDYSPDICMNIFTQDQKARMRAVLELSPLRKALVESTPKVVEAEHLSVNLFPNPTDEAIHIKPFFKGIQDVQVDIISSQGKAVSTIVFPNTYSSQLLSIQLPTLASGLYFVKTSTSKESHVSKLVVR
ncbi:MAG: M43 family zinc metalloprotease [Bacteroidota bacterium]